VFVITNSTVNNAASPALPKDSESEDLHIPQASSLTLWDL